LLIRLRGNLLRKKQTIPSQKFPFVDKLWPKKVRLLNLWSGEKMYDIYGPRIKKVCETLPKGGNGQTFSLKGQFCQKYFSVGLIGGNFYVAEKFLKPVLMHIYLKVNPFSIIS
jgi:hypothetical protein